MKKKLKMFVAEGVLEDWSAGMVCVLAENLEQVMELLKEKDESAYKYILKESFRVVEKPEAFVVWGGS